MVNGTLSDMTPFSGMHKFTLCPIPDANRMAWAKNMKDLERVVFSFALLGDA